MEQPLRVKRLPMFIKPVWCTGLMHQFDTPVWYACQQIGKILKYSASNLCHIFFLYFAAPDSVTNECPGLCGDSDCIEEWKNTASKTTSEDNSSSLSCIVGFIKTGDFGNDSLYTVHYQSIVSNINYDNHSHIMTDLRFGRWRINSKFHVSCPKLLLVHFKIVSEANHFKVWTISSQV